MSNQSSVVLLNRLLSLKENSPFLVAFDSLSQSAYYLIQEFIHRLPSNTNVVYLSFETLNKPKYATHFLDCSECSLEDVGKFVHEHLVQDKKTFVIIDSLNYINNEDLSQFVSTLVTPQTILLGVFHTNVPQKVLANANYPSSHKILNYIASTIFEVRPNLKSADSEYLDQEMDRLFFPVNSGLNSSEFDLVLTSRRKSGRSLSYKFSINAKNHELRVFQETKKSKDDGDNADDLLKELTTFNLSTSSRQKLAKDQVDLPFLEAQTFGAGGAIVYEFEKDDDYDEEDPYEDPF